MPGKMASCKPRLVAIPLDVGKSNLYKTGSGGHSARPECGTGLEDWLWLSMSENPISPRLALDLDVSQEHIARTERGGREKLIVGKSHLWQTQAGGREVKVAESQLCETKAGGHSARDAKSQVYKTGSGPQGVGITTRQD
jgi:hypothetical protein